MSATAFVVASGVKVNQGGPISPLKALTEFFNVGDGKRVTREWGAEIKELTPADKIDLCKGIAEVTGWEITGLTASKA